MRVFTATMMKRAKGERHTTIFKTLCGEKIEVFNIMRKLMGEYMIFIPPRKVKARRMEAAR